MDLAYFRTLTLRQTGPTSTVRLYLPFPQMAHARTTRCARRWHETRLPLQTETLLFPATVLACEIKLHTWRTSLALSIASLMKNLRKPEVGLPTGNWAQHRELELLAKLYNVRLVGYKVGNGIAAFDRWSMLFS